MFLPKAVIFEWYCLYCTWLFKAIASTTLYMSVVKEKCHKEARIDLEISLNYFHDLEYFFLIPVLHEILKEVKMFSVKFIIIY